MRYLQGQLTLALQSYTSSGGSGGGVTGGGGGDGVGSGVSLCDTTLTSLSSINVNTSMYPPSTSSLTSSPSSLTASASDQTRRTFLNQLFGTYFAGGGISTTTTPTSSGSTETKASVTGADTETRARHRVVFMFPTRLPANTTENTLFFSGVYRPL